MPEELNLKKFFSSIVESVNDPFIVMDRWGNIISINRKAVQLLSLENTPTNLTEIFNEETVNNFIQIATDVVKQRNQVEREKFEVEFIEEYKLELDLNFNLYEYGGKEFIFLTLIQSVFYFNADDVTKLEVKTGNISKLIPDKNLIELISEIHDLYPFTVVGKDKIKKMIDEFDMMIWIKDPDGNYITVNEDFAVAQGLNRSNIEGKKADEFLPSYIVDFFTSLHNYIRETLNILVLEGVPLKGMSNSDKYQLIEVPLFDSRNEIFSIVGFAILKEEEIVDDVSAYLDLSDNIVETFSGRLAYIDNDGKFKQTSLDFIKLFEDKYNHLNGTHYVDVFPAEFSEYANLFQNSDEEKVEFFTNSEFEPDHETSADYKVVFTKIYIDEENYEGFTILIEDHESTDDLEKLITSKGAMFEILIQKNPEPVYIYDKENLSFLEVNEAALDLYGYSREEFLQMDLTDLYSPEDIQTLLGSSNGEQNEGEYSKPFRQKRKDGSNVFVTISKTTFTFQDKDAHFNIVKDVTSKLELEKINQQFLAAFQNSDDLIFITDKSGFVKWMNNAVVRELGYNKEELEDTSFAALSKDADRATINTTVFQSLSDDAVSLIIDLKKKDSTFKSFELIASPVKDFNNDIDSYTVLAKVQRPEADSSGEPIIKEVIKEVYVEKESDGLTVSAEYLSKLFHEILTPLNVILGFSQELTESIDEPTENQKETAEIININRKKLLNIMNTIIEYSELQKIKESSSEDEILITRLIEELDSSVKEITGDRDSEFAYGKISSSLRFKTDKTKFQNLVSILLRTVYLLSDGNKIYFSAYPVNEEKFAIIISDNYSETSTEVVRNLKGILSGEKDPKDYDVPRLTTEIVNSYLSILNGEIDYSVNNDETSEYRLLFPLNVEFEKKEDDETPAPEISSADISPEPEYQLSDEITPAENIEDLETETKLEEENFDAAVPEDEQKMSPIDSIESEIEEISKDKDLDIDIDDKDSVPPVKTMEQVDLSQLRCLYIEDQVDSQILFKVQMKGLKEIKFAVGFEDALPLLENEQFDFIVMDINLQGEYNGLDALKIIHKMPGYENIPIVAVTAYVLPGDKEKFIATGFNDFISKPIFREKMIESLERIFLMQRD